MESFVKIDKQNNGNYIKMLVAIAKLSKLYSDSTVPFIYYRAAENIFCKSFKADNLSRSDTAFDANYNSIGVGLKTFLCNKESSTEKISEFNQLSKKLKLIHGKELAIKLSEFRNERISFAKRLYGIQNSIYHIVARREKKLLLFETDYREIDIDNIKSVKQNDSNLQFEDGNNYYSYNFSKSTLFKKFYIPQNAFQIPIDIIEDPYVILLDLFEDEKKVVKRDKYLVKGQNYVILPLYSTRAKEKIVPEKSGLNQWNAGGRKRDIGEVYIPIPAEIHKQFPNFFPKRDTEFNLQIPIGEMLSAKVCQDNSKALMTNPNKALAEWLLRKVFALKEGELATIEKMYELGFDSVIITKVDNQNYKIDKAKIDSYDYFIGTELPIDVDI